MNFTHILLSSIPQNEKLIEYGFFQQENKFVLKKKLDEEFYVVVSLNSDSLIAEVFENESDEKYALLDVKTARGAFVNEIRAKVNELVSDVEKKCFVSSGLKQEYVNWLEKELAVQGDFPFQNDDTSMVFRCDNSKWFALVMRIKFKNLGLESDEPVWIVNLKADSDKISELVDKKSIFPAWHMNKKHWITVLLTATTDSGFNKLKQITLRSKELVEN